MAAPMNFRSAFNGFNREDVVHFIEYLNARHTAEINQLKAELDLLHSRAQSEDQDSELEALREENERLTRQVDQLNMETADLNSRLEDAYRREPCSDVELQARLEALQARYDALKAEKEASSSTALELEAYRRAERAEREAKERAELIYRRANGALADAAVRVDEAFVQIGDLTDKVSAQLQQLQLAVTDSRQALSDAASSLATIAPGSNP